MEGGREKEREYIEKAERVGGRGREKDEAHREKERKGVRER